jgi:hypothetical protein
VKATCVVTVTGTNGKEAGGGDVRAAKQRERIRRAGIRSGRAKA